MTAVKDGMDEAKKLRQGELKTEHLLLALSKIRDDTSAALHKSGATEDALRKACARRAGISELELMNPFANNKTADGLIPLAADVKLLFETVANDAEAAAGDPLVSTRELVEAMTRDVTCGAHAVLTEDLDVDLDELRAEMRGEKKELVGAGAQARQEEEGQRAGGVRRGSVRGGARG